MATEPLSYLVDVGQHLRLDKRRQQEIVRELHTHIEDRTRELEERGFSEAQSLKQAVQELGSPHEIGRQLHSIHSTSSWKDVIMATLPHILLASFFSLHLWTHIFWVVVGLVTATLVAMWAWWAGRPKWTYSWLGYALAAPTMAWLLAMASVGYGVFMFFSRGTPPLTLPIYIGIALYIPFSLWAVVRITRKVVRQDWLLASLTILPLPFLGSWLFFQRWRGGLLTSETAQTQRSDADTAIVFLVLALTTALFMKIGQRPLRIALLVIAVPVLLALATLNFRTNTQALSIIIATFATAAFLISPALLESRSIREERLRDCLPQ